MVAKTKSNSAPPLQSALREQMALVMDVEEQVVLALGKLSRTVTAPELRRIITRHLAETKTQARRLKKAARSIGGSVKTIHCAAVRGLIRELTRICRHSSPALHDACVSAHLQQIEHYEISAYDTLCAWSKACGAGEVIVLCGESLEEEKNAAAALSRISETVLLPHALWNGDESKIPATCE